MGEVTRGGLGRSISQFDNFLYLPDSSIFPRNPRLKDLDHGSRLAGPIDTIQKFQTPTSRKVQTSNVLTADHAEDADLWPTEGNEGNEEAIFNRGLGG